MTRNRNFLYVALVCLFVIMGLGAFCVASAFGAPPIRSCPTPAQTFATLVACEATLTAQAGAPTATPTRTPPPIRASSTPNQCVGISITNVSTIRQFLFRSPVVAETTHFQPERYLNPGETRCIHVIEGSWFVLKGPNGEDEYLKDFVGSSVLFPTPRPAVTVLPQATPTRIRHNFVWCRAGSVTIERTGGYDFVECESP